MSIEAELEKIRRAHGGTLNPSDVVTFAKANPKSALHARFNWNVKEAAKQQWLLVARNIIRVHIEVLDPGDGYKEPVRSYVSVAPKKNSDSPEGGYVRTETILDDADTRETLVKTQLDRLWSVYKSYPLPELAPVRSALERCLRDLERVKSKAA